MQGQREQFYHLGRVQKSATSSVFSAVDHFDACCVGIHAAKVGNRFAALQPIAQGL
jgi:hypothetical protein